MSVARMPAAAGEVTMSEPFHSPRADEIADGDPSTLRPALSHRDPNACIHLPAAQRPPDV